MKDTNDPNPYAAPSLPSSWQRQPIVSRVDGNCIVVNNGAELPMRCIATNAACSFSDQKVRKLNYVPSFRLVVSGRNCLLFCCLSNGRRKRHLFARIIVFAVLFAIGWIIFELLLVAATIAAGFFFSLPPDRLKVVNYKNGEFWISGLNEDFLDSLVSEDGWTRV